MIYGNRDDASLRLRGSIIRLKKTPIHVTEVDGGRIFFDYLRSGRAGSCDGDDVRIDLTPVPLGFVNLKGGVMRYLYRQPQRRYKQGLEYGMISSCAEYESLPFRNHGGLRNLCDTIQGIYPTLDEARRSARRSKGGERAFSREFGIRYRDGVERIVYRYEEVGEIKGDDFSLEDSHFYLKEMLESRVDFAEVV